MLKGLDRYSMWPLTLNSCTTAMPSIMIVGDSPDAVPRWGMFYHLSYVVSGTMSLLSHETHSYPQVCLPDINKKDAFWPMTTWMHIVPSAFLRVLCTPSAIWITHCLILCMECQLQTMRGLLEVSGFSHWSQHCDMPNIKGAWINLKHQPIYWAKQDVQNSLQNIVCDGEKG